MEKIHYVSLAELTLEKLEQIQRDGCLLELSMESTDRIQSCRKYLEDKLKHTDLPFYGINTGFGAFYNIKISGEEVATLQRNLVRSHACGIGDEVPPELVRLMIFLKIQSLSYGYSGVRLEVVDRLIHFYNHNAIPIVYQLGSLGASGDLAPLAHLSLPLIGEGEMRLNGQLVKPKEALEKWRMAPLQLAEKEGLALLNGTQFSSAYGVWCLIEARRLFRISNLVAAMSVDAFDGNISPFDERLHRIRAHEGQLVQ